ncbi:hypothetical protein M9H77_06139 [Catharanthus roseus]|uniref:Uncharacterized protein n=1 Tax=Catharanthus roseus TaxID=4058 RepID=A0ACC0BRF6_CATRO|nr:hypothetical protein M9H77_06139 [Catharanthus roseus]
MWIPIAARSSPTGACGRLIEPREAAQSLNKKMDNGQSPNSLADLSSLMAQDEEAGPFFHCTEWKLPLQRGDNFGTGVSRGTNTSNSTCSERCSLADLQKCMMDGKMRF